MAKECVVCGKPLGLLSVKVQVLDGSICDVCWSKTGFGNDVTARSKAHQYSGKALKELVMTKEQNKARIKEFKPTKKIGKLLFDDNTETFVIKQGLNKADLFRYDQIVSFELLEDGESVTKGGLGSAIAGGLMFGGVGAIVGGVTGSKKSKGICNSLQIKVTLRNTLKQTMYIPYITNPTKTNSSMYRLAYREAQDCLSALQLAVDRIDSGDAAAKQNTEPGMDEIWKYKELLDAGIISPEEFESKKKQLLGL